MTPPRPPARCAAVLAGLLAAGLLVPGLAACGGTATGSGQAPTSGLAVATPPPPDSADPDEDDPDDASTTRGPVSADSASEDQITEALAAAGVGEPGRWATAVVAHRPYPAGDRSLTALRTALAGSGADPATVKRIAAALTP